MKDIVNISVDRLWPHPKNLRKEPGDLTELAESIRKNGIMQNLTVVPLELVNPEAAIKLKEKNYTVLIGHRRLEAAKLAGITELPCRIASDIGEKEQISTMLEENMQRRNLTIYEEAQGFQMMMDFGETETSIAAKTGFTKKTIRHRLIHNLADTVVMRNGERVKHHPFFFGIQKIIRSGNRFLPPAFG